MILFSNRARGFPNNAVFWFLKEENTKHWLLTIISIDVSGHSEIPIKPGHENEVKVL